MFVYILQEDGGGPVKIGYAFDVWNRMNTLQCGNPRRLRLVAHFYCGDRQIAARVECALLRKHAARRIGGEWLDITPNNLVTDIQGLLDVERTAASP